MPFQLFSLPQHAYTKIINSMNPCELFFTSLCSQNAYSIIKMHRRKIKNSRICTRGNFEIEVWLYGKYLKFRQSSEIPNRKLRRMAIDGNSIRYELEDDDVFITYWTEPIEGTMKLIEHISYLFDVKVEQMDIYCNSGERLMLWVQRHQSRLEKAKFLSHKNRKNRFPLETLTNLIEVCKAESIVVDAFTTKSLQPFNKKCNFLEISIGSRLTIEHLMALDCVGIVAADRHNFTSKEMNRFFKHWMSGGSPRLTLLKVHMNDFNEPKVLDGINVKWNENTVHIRTHQKDSTYPFEEFFEIQGATNGMTAGFKFLRGTLYFGVWPCFVPLSLFRLPHLASMEIINAMDTTEQLLTSLCSRRAFSVIKSLRRGPNDITMKASDGTLVISDGGVELISHQTATESHEMEKMTVNGHSTAYSYIKKKRTINTFWEEPVIGTKELIEHVGNLFGTRVDTLIVENDSGTELLKSVQRRQGSLRMVSVTSIGSMENRFEPEDVKNIIMECESETIQIEALHSTPFEIRNLHKRFKVFKCLSGTWITVDNLLTLDCIQITVKEKKFTCAEMNRFIKHWVNGGSPRLRILRVPVTEQNMEELFEGINAQWNMTKLIFINRQRYIGFFEILRRDGRSADFRFFSNTFWFACTN
uniref:F-box domain-containing protein n=1 Tax=Caenorhabditis tropicalis TaxID=1561998 RepID=A0A1I7U9H8_9PELO